MSIKEIRKKIRECKTVLEFYAFREELENQGIILIVKRWHDDLLMDTNNGDFDIEDDGSICIRFPPDWSIRYKNIKVFSYNVKMEKGKEKSLKDYIYRDKLNKENSP